MVHPSWWAVVWIECEGDSQDVVRIDDWGGALALRDGMLREAEQGNASFDVFDHHGRMVMGFEGKCNLQTMAPAGGPVMMQAPMVEGRWLWHKDGTFTRDPVAPTRRVIEWASQAEMRARQDQLLVVPYDLDPNPVSIAMRLRKRVYDEKFARENPDFKR